jgi:hypothetical protein
LISFPGSIIEEFGNTLPAPLVFKNNLQKEKSSRLLEIQVKRVTSFVNIGNQNTNEEVSVAIPKATELPKKIRKKILIGVSIILILLIGIALFAAIIFQSKMDMENDEGKD